MRWSIFETRLAWFDVIGFLLGWALTEAFGLWSLAVLAPWVALSIATKSKQKGTE